MKEKHILLVYPGLSDGRRPISLFTDSWDERFGIEVLIHEVPWRDQNETFEEKCSRALEVIDRCTKQADYVSLLGISGGGSFALNLLAKRLNSLHKMVNVCGRLKKGEDVYPTLEQSSIKTPTFYESVMLAEKNEKKLKPDDRARIMTVRPRFGDEVVPVSTVPVEGGNNIQIPTTEHMLSIAYSLLFPSQIINFLSK